MSSDNLMRAIAYLAMAATLPPQYPLWLNPDVIGTLPPHLAFALSDWVALALHRSIPTPYTTTRLWLGHEPSEYSRTLLARQVNQIDNAFRLQGFVATISNVQLKYPTMPVVDKDVLFALYDRFGDRIFDAAVKAHLGYGDISHNQICVFMRSGLRWLPRQTLQWADNGGEALVRHHGLGAWQSMLSGASMEKFQLVELKCSALRSPLLNSATWLAAFEDNSKERALSLASIRHHMASLSFADQLLVAIDAPLLTADECGFLLGLDVAAWRNNAGNIELELQRLHQQAHLTSSKPLRLIDLLAFSSSSLTTKDLARTLASLSKVTETASGALAELAIISPKDESLWRLARDTLGYDNVGAIWRYYVYSSHSHQRLLNSLEDMEDKGAGEWIRSMLNHWQWLYQAFLTALDKATQATHDALYDALSGTHLTAERRIAAVVKRFCSPRFQRIITEIVGEIYGAVNDMWAISYTL